ncbi:isopentenyl-diphosphate delta-isomerase [Nocardiopsis sp. TSRI0078]|uniref:isopentenyl-diphosphate Delta-isomerase n=1 Tax=unclassified Nocardiopsis TaxID=2649073 RepID=UPI00093E00A3|nr:isopentenyl-diphosphate Delta-isomerase [Nocardiopsis sp. TSRI0078]OKI23532.1 isopentenyl-diphosphate delta-isomerase [Nocardiopsis sp. TSRI0078]
MIQPTAAVTNTGPGRELVVLLDEDHRRVGVADKATVHTEDTPLHLAFSCYVLDADGRVLITRRALGKTTWPGVWTNSCCGHPAPDEDFEEAVRRRVAQELGMDVTGVRPALPDFRYRAVSAEGIVENEFCPVFWARAEGEAGPRPDPDPSEVAEYAWAEWPDLVAVAERTPWLLSPWAVEQIPRMNP